jgi:hypothetical protein
MRKPGLMPALVLAAGLASGLALPKALDAAAAWAAYCYEGICYIETRQPTAVDVWIQDSYTGQLRLQYHHSSNYAVALEANPR